MPTYGASLVPFFPKPLTEYRTTIGVREICAQLFESVFVPHHAHMS